MNRCWRTLRRRRAELKVPEKPGLRGVKRSSDEQLQEDTEASVSRIEVPETPGLRGVKRRSDEQLQEDTEASESRIDGTCTQDNPLRRVKRRRYRGRITPGKDEVFPFFGNLICEPLFFF